MSFARQVHVGKSNRISKMHETNSPYLNTKNPQDTLLTKDEPGTSMIGRIRNHLPEEAHHLLSGRVQMIK